VNAADHIDEAHRLIGLAHSLQTNDTDAKGRVTLASDYAAHLAAMATAHATIAIALEAEQARRDRNAA
jgi:hypothetical protein